MYNRTYGSLERQEGNEKGINLLICRKTSRLRFIVVAISCSLVGSQVGATTYYVCNLAAECNAGAGSDWGTGNDSRTSAEAQNKATPWKHPEYAMSPASGVGPGDTVVVGDGTYIDHGGDNGAINIRISGTNADNYIILKAENDYQAHIDASASGLAAVVFRRDVGYVKVEGFDLFGGGSVVRMLEDSTTKTRGPDHLWIYNNKIHDNRDATYYSSCIAQAWSETYTLIERNEFYNCGPGPVGWNSDCPEQCEKSLGYGIYLQGAGHIIRNNVFRDPNTHAGPHIKADHRKVEHEDISPHVTIVNNTFSGYPGFVDNGDDLVYPDTTRKRGWHIWVIGGVSHGDPVNLRPQDYVIVANNAFHNLGYRRQNDTGGWGCNAAICFTRHEGTNWKIYNNRTDSEIFDCYAGNDPDPDPPAAPITDENLDESDGWEVSHFGFTNIVAREYSLQSSSLMIDKAREVLDAATATRAPADDFSGRPRPQGAGYDIGAFEYIDVNDVTPPLAPKNLVIMD